MSVNPARFAKATNAGIGAGIAALAVLLAGDGGIAITELSAAQWSTFVVGVAGVFWTTYNTPNAAYDSPSDKTLS